MTITSGWTVNLSWYSLDARDIWRANVDEFFSMTEEVQELFDVVSNTKGSTVRKDSRCTAPICAWKKKMIHPFILS